VLSTTTAPASTNFGAHSELTEPPAEEITRSRPWIEAGSSTRHSISPPLNSIRRPFDRCDAKGTTSEAGKLRSASTSRIVEPTAPVAPTMPIL
jgi:hypothetical protein